MRASYRSACSACCLVVAFVLLPALAHAQVASGPEVGSKLEKLEVIAGTGPDAGKEVDFVAQRKEAPTIYVFVQAELWSRPMARFIKALDDELANKRRDVALVAVWLSDNVDASRNYVPVAQQVLKLQQTTLAVYPGGTEGPNGWGINPDAHCTAIVAAGGKVVATFGYRSLNETDAPDVIKALPPAE
jgi:hypothetical protein